MTPAASQAFRRTIRQDDKIRLAAENRIRGEKIDETLNFSDIESEE